MSPSHKHNYLSTKGDFASREFELVSFRSFWDTRDRYYAHQTCVRLRCMIMEIYSFHISETMSWIAIATWNTALIDTSYYLQYSSISLPKLLLIPYTKDMSQCIDGSGRFAFFEKKVMTWRSNRLRLCGQRRRWVLHLVPIKWIRTSVAEKPTAACKCSSASCSIWQIRIPMTSHKSNIYDYLPYVRHILYVYNVYI